MGETKKETLVKKSFKRYTRYPKISFDKLQMYFGLPHTIDIKGTEGSITIYQPTIGNIVEFGEKNFYSTLNLFCCNTSSYKVVLWDSDPMIDWNEISDFDLFISLYKNINPDASKLIFGDLDFSTFELCGKHNPASETEEYTPTLYSSSLGIEIDETVYQHIHQYLQNVFNIFPEEKYTKDPFLKKWWVDKERRELSKEKEDIAKGKKDADSSALQSIISACINHPGFKYNLEELKMINVCQFYDSVARLQVYESSTACLKGMYSGFVDGSKIKPEEYNFMKEIK